MSPASAAQPIPIPAFAPVDNPFVDSGAFVEPGALVDSEALVDNGAFVADTFGSWATTELGPASPVVVAEPELNL